MTGVQTCALPILNISYNPVKDISPILECPAIERLWLAGCYLSDDQLNAARAAFPDATIVTHGSGSTGSGWREHPRYTTLQQMYKTGKYIPFE